MHMHTQTGQYQLAIETTGERKLNWVKRENSTNPNEHRSMNFKHIIVGHSNERELL